MTHCWYPPSIRAALSLACTSWPSGWNSAARPEVAEPLVTAVVAGLRGRGATVETGRFGALMAVRSVNDGPFTLLIEI